MAFVWFVDGSVAFSSGRRVERDGREASGQRLLHRGGGEQGGQNQLHLRPQRAV